MSTIAQKDGGGAHGASAIVEGYGQNKARSVQTTEQWAICPANRSALFRMIKAEGIHMTFISTDLTQDDIYLIQLRKQVCDQRMH